MRPSTVLAVGLLVAGCMPDLGTSWDEPPKKTQPPPPAAPADEDPPPPLPAPRGAPVSLTASDGTGLRLVSLHAQAVVQDPLAFTELHFVFHNPEARTIEGQFEITLPDGAAVSRFAMRQARGWQEGEVVELQAARRAYEDFLHRRQDPALLEKQAGSQFHARVFPIAASGDKEIILSYSEELTHGGAPYRVHLRGLPEMDALEVRVMAGSSELTLQKQRFTPDADFEVPLSDPHGAAPGLRHENLVVARITPLAEAAADPIDGLVVLLDTSASRALDFAADVEQLGRVVAQLARSTPAAPLRVACFDQEVAPMFDGTLGDFGAAELAQIAARRPLGASDLGRALAWAGAHPYARVLLVSDGVATAGTTDAAELRAAVGALAQRGVERLDALVSGGLRDAALLAHLVTAGLPRAGVVLDGALPAAALTHRLRAATVSGVKVRVAGSQWVWPEQLDGIQPGDQVLVYADVPESQSLQIQLDGAGQWSQPIALTEVERPLLERAWVGARIARLLHERDALDADPGEVQRQVVELSTRFRVLSDYTALLVLESEADYARFHINRRALADILVVGARGIERQSRTTPPPLAPQVGTEVGAMGRPHAPGTTTPTPAAPTATTVRTDEPAEPKPDKAEKEMAAPNDDKRMAGKKDELRPADPAARDPIAVPVVATPAPPRPEAPAPPAAAPAQAHFSRHAAARGDNDRMDLLSPLFGGGEGGLRGGGSGGPNPWQESQVAPYHGKLARVMSLLRGKKRDDALAAAWQWRDHEPGDVLALIALGEAFEARSEPRSAARAYGSLIDLYPSRADLRRFAGERLERLGTEGLTLAVDTYRQARAQRPDHPASHRLLAWALVRAGEPAEAFRVIVEGAARRYPDDRFAGVDRILREDVGLIGAAWIHAAPQDRRAIARQVADAGATLPTARSLRFVLNWETDANDVDFHILDARGGHAYFSQRALDSGGELYADVTTGYGPECFTIEGRPAAYPYKLAAHYYSRGPMGYGMGKLEIIEHDGQGGFRFEERPFVIMTDGAFVDLGTVRGPLGKNALHN